MENLQEKTKPHKRVISRGDNMDQKKRIYDELSRVLTDFENGEANEIDLYNMLMIIQIRWEDTITAVN